MRRFCLLMVAISLGVATVGCSDDDATSPSVEDNGDTITTDEVTTDSDDATGSLARPQIDPALMPAPGDVQHEVEGATYDYAAADAATSAYSCSVSSTAIVVELQVSGGAMATQANSSDGQSWQGTMTLSHPDTDRIYFSSPGIDGTFAVDGTMAVYEGAFHWRTSSDPGLNEDAGTGTVRITC